MSEFTGIMNQYSGNFIVLGTCSKCNGPVVIPAFYWSVVPPTPQCTHCGAYKKQSYGPVIEMESYLEENNG